MPHCIIEYAKPVEQLVQLDELMSSVYLGAKKSGLFEPSDIKVRAIPFTHFSLGNIQHDFVHVCVKILSGRTLEQRKILSASVLDEVSRLFESSISITVEVVNIEKAFYSKLVL
jgi:5-carboxymethyl-2-hydroxymuconate isomerase